VQSGASLKFASTPAISAQVFLKAVPLISSTQLIFDPREGDKDRELSQEKPVEKDVCPSALDCVECRILANAKCAPYQC
jgi:hypothetical protein